jgi:hypothetical protein
MQDVMGKPEEKTQLVRSKDDWKYDKRILRKEDGSLWTGFIWLRIGINTGYCEHGNEPSISIL